MLASLASWHGGLTDARWAEVSFEDIHDHQPTTDEDEETNPESNNPESSPELASIRSFPSKAYVGSMGERLPWSPDRCLTAVPRTRV